MAGTPFSDTTLQTGHIQEIESILDMPYATISGDTTTLLPRITQFLNAARRELEVDVLQAEGAWKWDDVNYTDLPRATQDLSTSTRNYLLPVAATSGNAASFLKLTDISVLDSLGKEHTLTETHMEESELNRIYATAGMPQVYRLIGNTAKVWPLAAASFVTTTAGFIVDFQRTGKDFLATGDNTQQSGFALPRLLSLQAALDYAASKTMQIAQHFMNERERLHKKLMNLYTTRNSDRSLGLDRPQYMNFH